MEPHGLSPWYLHKNTLLRPWAPKRSRLREARYGGRRKVGAQGFGGLSASGEIRRSSDTSVQD